ncbi:hypothetical protein FACS1894137_07760 [Spirochaetia bacterium]|nr:hypothetical protein FACS1894137_07760 [Spirochaetia bacterium]
MNKNAFNILNGKKLVRASEYSLDEAGNLPSNKEIFLRYNELFKINNKKVNSSYIINNMKNLQNELENNELIQIVESIDSIAGGIIYIKDGFVYGEYVEGNIILLLRRGICRKRFLICPDTSLYELSALQNMICNEKIEKYEVLPFDGHLSGGFNVLITLLKENIHKFDDNLLLEILIERDRIVFCDAKYKNLGLKPDILNIIFLKSESTILLKGHRVPKIFLSIDNFDIDKHTARKNIGIRNGAILSHFITYNINNIENLLFLG